MQCPQGQWSRAWRKRTEPDGQPVIEVHFDQKGCAACQVRSLCTKAKKEPRLLKLRPASQDQALQAARERQTTVEFTRKYAKRAGVEATISQGTRAFNLRRSRYMGLAKTHLQHVATAAAMNLSRKRDWWKDLPVIEKRISRFASLGPQAVSSSNC
ncbi:MAG: transposase [Hormoscilla sp. GM102CHS1]|nr:transposase [Hormoscilla sp. GM102CHS1]